MKILNWISRKSSIARFLLSDFAYLMTMRLILYERLIVYEMYLNLRDFRTDPEARSKIFQNLGIGRFCYALLDIMIICQFHTQV